MELKNIIRDLRKIVAAEDLEKTRALVDMLLEDEELRAMMNATNIIVVSYLKYNDHGWSHAVITMRNALKILTIIKDILPPNIVKYNLGSFDDAAFVTALAAFLHDVGNMIHRESHWEHSLWLTRDMIWNIINRFYENEDKRKKWLLFAHIANAIYSHDEKVQAFTIEASAVKVGDGCDMAAGRSRKPYNIGKVDIHSVSALSITDVEMSRGIKKPLRITVNMTSPAGIFQVEDVLLPKIKTSMLEGEIEIETLINGKRLKLSKSPL